MASTDWGTLNDVIDATSVRRGVTNGIARPNGGGNFVFGCNSAVSTAGAFGLYAAQTNYAPLAKGGSISGAIQRGPSGGPLNFAPFFFLGLQANSVNATGYMLGPDNDDPHRIVMRKGALISGLPAVSIGTQGILMAGTETFLNGTWLHLRFDMIANTNGDVILKGFRSDLTANPVTAPVWVPIPGCDVFVDDVLGVNSGSTPYVSGYVGFGFQTQDITRRAYFDQITVERQL